MNNELTEQKVWWKWLVPTFGIVLIATIIFFTSGMGVVGVNLAQAYGDTELYENALVKVKTNHKVI